MKASLGSLLWLWADIERTTRAGIVRHCGSLPKSAHGISASLRFWRAAVCDSDFKEALSSALCAQLQPLLLVRNGLCHGFNGIQSGPAKEAKFYWELNGEAGSIDWIDYQLSLDWLSTVPRVISSISGPQSVDSAENREWWATEFPLLVSA